MGWARFDDQYSDNPKILEAGPWAELLDMRAIIWCARHETDGLVTRAALKRIGHGIPKLADRVNSLVEVGRWIANPTGGGGYLVHDFLDYNPSKAEKEDQRRRGRERVRKHRDMTGSNALQTRISLRGGDTSKSESDSRSRLVSRCARCDRLIGDGWRDCECPDLTVIAGNES